MPRAYLSSHPWLTFKADLRSAPPELWMLLGEARSKCEHIRGVPLRPETANRLHQVYLAKGVQATTAIEGNTLDEGQVLARVLGEGELPESQEYLGREVDNMISLCNRILNDLLADPSAAVLTIDRVLEYNATVLSGLRLAQEVSPGEIRQHQVVVGRYRGAPPEDCGYLVDRLCSWLASDAFSAEGHGLALPILKAAIAHLYLAWIHPFGDGNGRTARAVEFHILVESGVPSPAAHLMSNHYNQTRVEYYRQLDAASRSGGKVVPFLLYAMRGFVDQLAAQLKVIRSQQWDVAWQNYVHELLGNANPTAQRRRHVVLDLSAVQGSEWIPVKALRRISGRVAEGYAGKQEKTVTRDLNALKEMGLVRTSKGKVRANREVILAFLPDSVDAPTGEDVPTADGQLPLFPRTGNRAGATSGAPSSSGAGAQRELAPGGAPRRR